MTDGELFKKRTGLALAPLFLKYAGTDHEQGVCFWIVAVMEKPIVRLFECEDGSVVLLEAYPLWREYCFLKRVMDDQPPDLMESWRVRLLSGAEAGSPEGLTVGEEAGSQEAHTPEPGPLP